MRHSVTLSRFRVTLRISGIFLLASFLTDGLVAQDTLTVGTPVRVAGPTPSVKGRFLAVSRDSLLIGITSLDTTRAVSLSGITSLEQNLKNNEHHSLRGALWGTFIGMTVGAIASVPNTDGMDDMGAWAGSGALAGAGLGLIIGEVAGRDRWRELTLPPTRADALPSAQLRPQLFAQAQLRSVRSDGPVRLRTFDGRELRGLYVGVEDGQVRVLGDTLQLVPFASIRNIQQLQPATFSFAKRGAVTGAITGALVFLLPLAFADDSCGGSGDGLCVDGRGYLLMFTPLGAAGGGLAGLVLGALFGSGTDRWQTIR
jgi:hypothetical protein